MAYQTYEERQGRGLPLQLAIPGYLTLRFRRLMKAAFEKCDDNDPEIRTFLVGLVRDFERCVKDTVLRGEGIFAHSQDHFDKAQIYIQEMLLSKGTNRWGKETFMHYAEGHPESVINFLDYVLYHEEPAGKGLCDRIQAVFDNNPTAYAVVRTQNEEGKPVRKIRPAMGKHSASKLRDALERIEESEVKRVLDILGEAEELLDNGNYTSAVNEGYAAVEYAAKRLAKQRTGHSGNVLMGAINRLNVSQESFQASIFKMVNIVSKYGNNGKRHKLDIPSDATQEDAVMYLGICAMAADYLISQMIEQPNGEGE